MSHIFFMIVPIVLIALSVMQLMSDGDRNTRLVWIIVLVVATAVLSMHSIVMDILLHLY